MVLGPWTQTTADRRPDGSGPAALPSVEGMTVAIITGASRGLGRALAAGLTGAGWDVVVDARDAAALAAGRAGRARGRPSPATSPTRPTARPCSAAADELGGADLLVNNAGILGPSPQPAAGRLSDRRAARGVRGQRRSRRSRSPSSLLPGLRKRGGIVLNVTSDAAVEPYPGWGGYGVGEGRPRAGEQRARRRGAGRTGVVGRPGRPAHPDAPGGVPRRGHQRPAGAVDRGAGLPAPAGGPPGVRPDQGRGRGDRPSTSPCPTPWWRTNHPRHAGRPATAYACSSPVRTACPTTCSATCPRVLRPGDLVVVNTSATLPAAVPTVGGPAVHFSTANWSTGPDDGTWLVELRRPDGPYQDGVPGQRFTLRGGATVTLDAPYSAGRLWVATVSTPDVPAYLHRHGEPIRYRYVRRPWPLSAYQTVFATHPGSAEMPSAGRPFTDRVVTRLVDGRRARRTAAAAHRRRVGGGARAAVPGVVLGPGRHRAGGRARQGRRRPGHRRRHDGRTGAGDHRRARPARDGPTWS